MNKQFVILSEFFKIFTLIYHCIFVALVVKAFSNSTLKLPLNFCVCKRIFGIGFSKIGLDISLQQDEIFVAF